MISILGLPNVGIHVRDADRSLSFYVDLLGFEIIRDSGWIEDSQILAMTSTPTPLRIVNVRAGTGATMSIVQARDAPETAAPREFHHPGSMHLAFDVTDVAGALAELAAAGFPTVGPMGSVSGTGAGAAIIGFVRDPDGFFVELLQR